MTWAETFLRDPVRPDRPLRLRWYQKEIIASTKPRQAIRAGRRIGKSVALATKALYRAFSRPHSKVLIVTPYESQVKALFDEAIRPMASDSPLLRQSIERDRSQPFEMQFKNGSRILGMTAGTRSGQHAAGVRGISADLLILDEADYLTTQALAAIEAILATHDKVEMIASSTPTGKREWFYTVCTDRKLGYAEFKYPSSVSPTWTTEQEREFRRTYSQEDYEHEFEAEWGSQAAGVFKPHFIDPSLWEYEYDDCDPVKLPGNVRILGVDWNAAKNGVQLTLVEYSRMPTPFPRRHPNGTVDYETTQGKLATIQHIEITDKVFTQHKALNMIFRVMVDYAGDFLYVDEGYGATNIEDLLLRAHREYPSLLMDKKLRSLNFSSTVTIQDPHTHLPVEKPVKPYMVSHAALRLEEGLCILPEHEDVPNGIVGQMRNYLVVRISDRGYPTYTSINEHALSSWMIALLGFAEEYSELKQADPTTTLRIVPASRMEHLRQTNTRSLYTDVPTPRQPEAVEKVQQAVQQAGMSDRYVYAGVAGGNWGGPVTSDDSDEAIDYRKRINEAITRPTIPWAKRPRRARVGSPVRANISVTRTSTPWSG